MKREANPIDRYLEKQSTALLKLSFAAQQRPSTRIVHELRVANRRTQTALWLLKHSSGGLRFKDLKQELKKLAKALGAARELDVAIRDAKSYGFDSRKLVSQRKSARKAVRRKLRATRRDRIARELSAARKTLAGSSGLKLQPAMRALRTNLRPWLVARSLSRKDLHRLRLEIKRARYVLEVLGVAAEPLRELQDLLGRAHDLRMLEQLVGKSPRLRRDQSALNARARQLIPPALRLVLRELDSRLAT